MRNSAELKDRQVVACCDRGNVAYCSEHYDVSGQLEWLGKKKLAWCGWMCFPLPLSCSQWVLGQWQPHSYDLLSQMYKFIIQYKLQFWPYTAWKLESISCNLTFIFTWSHYTYPSPQTAPSHCSTFFCLSLIFVFIFLKVWQHQGDSHKSDIIS